MVEQATITMNEFIKKHGLRMTFQPIERRSDSDSFKGFHHYKVTITRVSDAFYIFETEYSKGPGLPKGVELADVLNCLAMDFAGVDNAHDFEDWAGDYGYDTDSRKAEAIYDTIKRQARDFKGFLSGLKGSIGNSAYAEMLYEVERL